MKRIFTIIPKETSRMLLVAVLTTVMVSCDSILDFSDGDCSMEYRVKFTYDYNMEKVDAFAKEVKTVTLYAFDNEGNFIYQKTEEGAMLANDNYSMTVNIEPGDYHLVTWAGLDDQSFAVPLLTPGKSNIKDLTIKTLREKSKEMQAIEGEEGKYIVNKELSPLWHGRVVNQVFTRSDRQTIIPISLIKNTNNVRIVLAQVNQSSREPSRKLDVHNFSYSIYDKNGHMSYDNTLLDDNLLTYQPFLIQQGVITSSAFRSTPLQYPAAIAEMSVARLLETQIPRLSIINKETGEELLGNGVLTHYLNLIRLELYKEMPLQEYLDRESSFEITLFVNEKLTLINTVIEINGWVIQLNDFEL